MKIQRFIAPSFRHFSWLLVIGLLLTSKNESYAQCDTLLRSNVVPGMILRFWDSKSNNVGDTTDFRESLKIARNFKVVSSLIGDNCPGEQLDSLMVELIEASKKITTKQKAKLRQQQSGPSVRIGVIIRFSSTISVAHLFTIINHCPRFTIGVDLINNEILVTMNII